MAKVDRIVFAGGDSSTVTLVDSTGAAIPMRGRTLSVDAGGITLSGPGGMIIVVK